MTEPTSAQDLFKGRHFDQEIIILCVRWYLAFKLSSRDLVQMMAERGILLAHMTILRWVQRYVPDFEKRWLAYALPVGDSWRVDETYIKVRGQWVYLYRARIALSVLGEGEFDGAKVYRALRVRTSARQIR
jgi:transposase-like protein